jgi:hypothetical protein
MPRIRDITRLHNSMPHLLVGVGIVTGLQGTGSSDRGTRQALLNLIRDQNLNYTIADVTGGNIALVSLTCSLPPFSKEGQPIDVKCQVIGDATSLRNGQLVRAELRGVDGQTHVVAQGAVTVGGFTAQGGAASVQKNFSTTGWVNNGGLVIREVKSSYFSEAGDLELQVANPSTYNAMSIARGIKQALADMDVQVGAVDPTLVRGLDYYCRTTWEVAWPELGAQSGIGGGGRYDGLAESIGGPATPGVGFASGVERVLLALEEQERLPASAPATDAFFAIFAVAARPELHALLDRARDAGVACEADLAGRGVKGQMKQADRIGAARTVVCGDDEWARRVCLVRDMASGEQVEVPLDELVEHLVKAKG